MNTENGLPESGEPEGCPGNKDIPFLLDAAPGNYLSEILINTVIFNFYDNRLNVLLLHFKGTGQYSLPEGWVLRDETTCEASCRILRQHVAGFKRFFSEQFHVSNIIRQPEDNAIVKALEESGYTVPDNHWLNNRRISICYYSLVEDFTSILAAGGLIIANPVWADAWELPELVHGHEDIIRKAVRELQDDMDKKPIAQALLNKIFTLRELQGLYEAVYQKKYTRTNFHRKMLCSGNLVRLEKWYEGGAHKAPYAYRFKNRKW